MSICFPIGHVGIQKHPKGEDNASAKLSKLENLCQAQTNAPIREPRQQYFSSEQSRAASNYKNFNLCGHQEELSAQRIHYLSEAYNPRALSTFHLR